MKKIVFASNNAHKLAEIRSALGAVFELVSLDDAGFKGDIPETGDTLEANALEKALYIFSRLKKPVFADDSGLEVDALNGEPGVHSAHYSGTRNATANMDKLLGALGKSGHRQARFRTVIAYVDESGQHLFEGFVMGSIAYEPKGHEGFGYDPLFIPEGQQLTFAEMGMAQKEKMNHRVRALRKFVAWMEDRYEG